MFLFSVWGCFYNFVAFHLLVICYVLLIPALRTYVSLSLWKQHHELSTAACCLWCYCWLGRRFIYALFNPQRRGWRDVWGSLIDQTIYFSLLLHNKRQAFMSWAKNSSRSIFELMGSFSKSSTRGFSAPARGIKSCWFDRNRCFSLTELFIMLLSLKMVLSLGRYHKS